MKRLVLETTAPFQGLAELVAYDEDLFEKEGLTIEWIDREKGVDKAPHLEVTDPTGKGVNRFSSPGCSKRARPISTTPANGVTTPASKAPRLVVARSVAVRL